MAKKVKKAKVPKAPKPAKSAAQSQHDLRFWRYFFICVLTGVVVLAWLSLVTFDPYDPPSPLNDSEVHVIQNSAGVVGSYLAYYLHYWIGSGVFMGLVFGTISAGVLMLGGKIKDLPWRALGVALLIIVASTTSYLLDRAGNGEIANNSAGMLGRGVGEGLYRCFTTIGAWVVVAVVLGFGLMLAADNLLLRVPGWITRVWQRVGPVLASAISSLRISWPSPATAPANASSPRGDGSASRAMPKPAKAESPKAEPAKNEPAKGESPKVDRKSPLGNSAADETPTANAATAEKIADKPRVSIMTPPVVAPAPAPRAPETSSTAPVAAPKPAIKPIVVPAKPAVETNAAADKKDSTGEKKNPVGQYIVPSANLLAEPTGGYLQSQEAQAEQKRAVLQQTLTDFNVAAEVVGHMTGPVITLFELSLAPGVKVAQVQNLATDIARALAVPGVRIVSPIPNKDTVGVEVPNLDKEIVRIRELMNLQPEAQKKMSLPLYLGKDAGGGAIVADLSRMPHMLIAGTTGSGKSVCINTIIMSLLMTRTPEDVRFILVDPKMVEMAAFENIPHLLCPVVNDMKRAEEILEWAATKMDERYELLKEAGVKNIAGFNSLSKDEIYKRFGVEDEEEKLRIVTRLPYYVIIVDELADLIMTSSKEVESHIIRIAQKARAVGIHLILATQRPSVNVVTGLIKSNMPCRCSFRVASRQESRIVLDQNGADVLLGQGDMLFLQPGTSNLIRAQGTYVDDGEIRTVVDSVKAIGEPQYNSELMRMGSSCFGEDGGGERDELFDKAVEVVLQSQRGSVSLLQRRLQIGYSRSSRIIDQMAEAGILGDYKGSQARECNMTLDDWVALKGHIEDDQSGASSATGEPTSV